MLFSNPTPQKAEKLLFWLSLAQNEDFSALDADHDELVQTLIASAHIPSLRELALEVGLTIDSIMRWRGYWNSWYAVLLNLLLAAQVLEDRPAQARLWERVGALYNLRGEQGRATSAYHTTLNIASEEQNEESRITAAWAMTGLIDDARRRDAIGEAVGYIPEAVSMARGAEDTDVLANVYLVSANIYCMVDDWACGLEYAQMAYLYWQQTANRIGTAKALHVLGIVYHAIGRPVRAMQMAQRAAAAYQALGADYLLGLLDVLLGNLYEGRGNWPQAEQHYRQAMRHIQRYGATFDLAIAQQNLGTGFYERQMWDEAEHHLLDAVNAWRGLHANGQCVQALYVLGDMYAAQGRQADAIQRLQEALSLAEDIPPNSRLDWNVARARERLAELGA